MEKETAVVRLVEVEREKTGNSEKTKKNWAIWRIKGEVNGENKWATVKSFGREKPGTVEAFMKKVPCLCECQQGQKEMEYILKEVAGDQGAHQDAPQRSYAPQPHAQQADPSIKERLIVAQNSLTNAVAFCQGVTDPDAVVAIQMKFFQATWQLAHGLKEAVEPEKEPEDIDFSDAPF
jgi:hypothetical protein